MVKIESFKYEDGKIPAGYVCETCGAKDCRLWRRYQTFLDHQNLFCANCAEKDQPGHKLELEEPAEHMTHDQIGWLVPAVPTEDGETYWGYTSVPSAGCEWWDALPIRPGQRPPAESLTPYMKRQFVGMRRNFRFIREVMAEFAAHARERLDKGLPPEEREIARLEMFSK